MNRFLIILVVIFAVVSCSNEEDSFDQPVAPPSVNCLMNQWAYAQLNHHYLWREDLPDSASLDFELDFSEFFNLLKSPRDRFSYYKQNLNYTGSIVAQLPEDTGFEYQAFQNTNNELFYYVLYVKNKELQSLGINHGKWLKAINDTQFALGYFDANGLFVQETQVSISRGINETSDIYTSCIFDIADKRIAYFVYTSFGDKTPVRELFQQFRDAQATDIIIDLRYNGGGYVDTSIFLCTLLLPEECMGKDAEYLKYNDIVTEELFQSEGVRYHTYTFYDNNKISEYSFNTKTVYFLVSDGTASASEGTINTLRPYTDVVTIGTQTVGKGTGMYTIANNNYRYALVPITFRYYNTNWETVPDEGIVPDYIVSDLQTDTSWGLGDWREPMLNKALSLIVGEEALNEAFGDSGNGKKARRNATPAELGLTKVGNPSCLKYKNDY